MEMDRGCTDSTEEDDSRTTRSSGLCNSTG